jgi:hypothetical protein
VAYKNKVSKGKPALPPSILKGNDVAVNGFVVSIINLGSVHSVAHSASTQSLYVSAVQFGSVVLLNVVSNNPEMSLIWLLV